jgi:hypothetical protein
MNIYFLPQTGFSYLSNQGSDAPGIGIVNGHIRPIPGWGEGFAREIAAAVTVVRLATQFKVPGTTEAAIKAATEVIERQAANYLSEGGVLVV